MFISRKRHEREKQELIGAGHWQTDAVLARCVQGLLFLDAEDKIQPPFSAELGKLFRRQDLKELSFDKLLTPVVTPKTLKMARNHLAHLRARTGSETPEESNPLQEVEVRLVKSDGSFDTRYYSFDFFAMENPDAAGAMMVSVTDISERVQTTRELEDLRSQNQTQSEILRGILQLGRSRFGAFLQRTDASMKAIDAILKKPAREPAAFRNKLEETLDEVDRVRRDGAALRLTSLESAARQFEDALHELRSRSSLSGNDFLPLAVKHDILFSQFAVLRTLSAPAVSDKNRATAASHAPMTENGTLIINPARVFSTPPAPPTPRAAPAGSLEHTLQGLAEHIAQEQQKLAAIECAGLHLIPKRYLATVKNVAIQLIRNAILHGIEMPAVRKEAGKPEQGTLRMEFRVQADSSFELLFKDDGHGLDPIVIKNAAVSHGVLTDEAATKLRDRQAIKLIFKSGVTTLSADDGEPPHGTGMSFVRRYVHEAGGRIALASLPGIDTRFRITLPAVVAEDAQVA